jgi:hypothetical protein
MNYYQHLKTTETYSKQGMSYTVLSNKLLEMALELERIKPKEAPAS